MLKRTKRDITTIHKIQDLQSLLIGFLLAAVVVLTTMLYATVQELDTYTEQLEQRVVELETSE